MNEANRALIGVGDMHLHREYGNLCPSGAACPSAKSNAHRTPASSRQPNSRGPQTMM